MYPDLQFDAAYWQQRYTIGQTGWDVGGITPPLREYFAQIGPPDARRILIPGAGRAYEAEYLHQQGWPNVLVADLVPEPLADLKARVPAFPTEHLLVQDFFQLEPASSFDLIIEQTFFCALHPSLRPAYAQQCAHLLKPGGKLVGLLFNTHFSQAGPPFGGLQSEYEELFAPHFTFIHFEPATNSIRPRQGRELFICLKKK